MARLLRDGPFWAGEGSAAETGHPGNWADATRPEQTCEIWKIMKPPAETGFTLALLYALPFFAVKFFFS
jgi:hypothetical protein